MIAMNRILNREERIRLDIIKDLIKYDLLICKPISVRRSTGLLPATIDARRDAANAQTQTMATEHAQ